MYDEFEALPSLMDLKDSDSDFLDAIFDSLPVKAPDADGDSV